MTHLEKELFDELVSALEKHNLDIDDERGQGYDDKCNMKGKNNGVQKTLLDITPRAFYTPCGCHNLNLVLCDMANLCPRALSFFLVWYNVYILCFLDIFFVFFFYKMLEDLARQCA